jgi:hypothetical protein
LLGLDAPAVPIESLYFDDAGPHIIESGTSPPTGPRLGQVELVALGEHLKQVAVGVGQATPGTLRGLRAMAAADTLRTLELNADEHLRSGARAFARAGRDALARDLAVSDPDAFASALRAAGAALAAGSAQAIGLAKELTRLGATLDAAGRAPTAPAADTADTADTAAPAGPAPAAAPAAPARDAVPSTGLVELEQETGDLAGSLLRYHRYVATLGLGPSSLQELLGGPPADLARRAGQPAATAVTTETAEPVPITSLCYSGPDALARALSLREEVRTLLGQGVPVSALTDLVEEVFDLVQLGIDGGR